MNQQQIKRYIPQQPLFSKNNQYLKIYPNQNYNNQTQNKQHNNSKNGHNNKANFNNNNQPINYQYQHALQMHQQIKTLKAQKKLLQNKILKTVQLQHKIDIILAHNQEITFLNESLKNKLSNSYTQNQQLKAQLNQALCDLVILKNQQKKNINLCQQTNQELSLNRIKKWELQGFNSCQKNQISHLRQRLNDQQDDKNNRILKLTRQIDILNQHLKVEQQNNKTQQLQIKQLQQKYSILKDDYQQLQKDFQYKMQQHKRQVDNIKAKQQVKYHLQVQNIKKKLKIQIQTLQIQNKHLKNIIIEKQTEINQIKISNQKIKINYEDSINLLSNKLKQTQFQLSKLSNNHSLQIDLMNKNIEEKIDTRVVIAKSLQKGNIQQLQNQITTLNQLLKQKNQTIIHNAQQHSKIRNQLQNQIIKNKQQLEYCFKQLTQITQKFDKVHQQDMKKSKQQLNHYQQLLEKSQKQKKLILEQKDQVQKRITLMVQQINKISTEKMKSLDKIQQEMKQMKQINSQRSIPFTQRQYFVKKTKQNLQAKDNQILELAEKLKVQKQLNSQNEKLIQNLKLTLKQNKHQLEQIYIKAKDLTLKLKQATKKIKQLETKIKSQQKIKIRQQAPMILSNQLDKTIQKKDFQKLSFHYSIDNQSTKRNEKNQNLEEQHQSKQTQNKQNNQILNKKQTFQKTIVKSKCPSEII